MITWKRCKKCNKPLVGIADNMKQDVYCGDLMIGHCKKKAESIGDVLDFFTGKR